MQVDQSAAAPSAATEAFVDRVRLAALGAFELTSVVIGVKLGLYAALHAAGASTSTELAAATGTAERPVREWLEQNAAGGILSLVADSDDPTARRFALPDAHATALLDRESDAYYAPSAVQVVAAVRSLNLVLESFRSGAGFPFAAAGDDTRISEGEGNRRAYLGPLGHEWLPSIADVDARLRRDPAARVADIGCGYGWSSIGIALAYPTVRVDGLDLDAPAIDGARENARAAGVSDRVTFTRADAATSDLTGPYDLVTVLEAFHDMSQPVAILRAFRERLAEDGSILVVDMKTHERFAPPSDEHERYLYGWSVMDCLHGGFQDGGPGTGTVMRPATLRGYAEAAGLGRFEILPIEHEFWRFYRLRA